MKVYSGGSLSASFMSTRAVCTMQIGVVMYPASGPDTWTVSFLFGTLSYSSVDLADFSFHPQPVNVTQNDDVPMASFVGLP